MAMPGRGGPGRGPDGIFPPACDALSDRRDGIGRDAGGAGRDVSCSGEVGRPGSAFCDATRCIASCVCGFFGRRCTGCRDCLSGCRPLEHHRQSRGGGFHPDAATAAQHAAMAGRRLALRGGVLQPALCRRLPAAGAPAASALRRREPAHPCDVPGAAGAAGYPPHHPLSGMRLAAGARRDRLVASHPSFCRFRP